MNEGILLGEAQCWIAGDCGGEVFMSIQTSDRKQFATTFHPSGAFLRNVVSCKH